jgi:hypothetical protein
MPRSVNKVILVGNVGKDPEVKYSPSGTPVAKFSLATNEKFKDRNDQWQDRTEWHNIVAYPSWAVFPSSFHLVMTGISWERVASVPCTITPPGRLAIHPSPRRS